MIPCKLGHCPHPRSVRRCRPGRTTGFRRLPVEHDMFCTGDLPRVPDGPADVAIVDGCRAESSRRRPHWLSCSPGAGDPGQYPRRIRPRRRPGPHAWPSTAVRQEVLTSSTRPHLLHAMPIIRPSRTGARLTPRRSHPFSPMSSSSHPSVKTRVGGHQGPAPLLPPNFPSSRRPLLRSARLFLR